MKSRSFTFTGGAASYLWVGIKFTILSLFTIGFGYPWGLCIYHRWKARNTYINGKQLKFTGTGIGLIGLWIKWWLFCIITLGIYWFWVTPDLQRWITEHTDFRDA